MPLSAPEVLDREFLEIRARILELAACLDRLDRCAGSVAGDPRLTKIRAGLEWLDVDRPTADRAEQVQLEFSRAYDPQWRSTLGVVKS